jgi:predicted amidohydrolase YtcJ
MKSLTVFLVILLILAAIFTACSPNTTTTTAPVGTTAAAAATAQATSKALSSPSQATSKASSPTPKDDKADLVLENAKIVTVDSQDRIAEAVAVKGDKIIRVGTTAEIRSLVGPGTKVIDIKGKLVTPGIIDSHLHMYAYGRQFWEGYLDIRFPKVRDLEGLLKAIEARVKTTPAGEWISGNQGFHLGEDKYFDRLTLDKSAPNNPVYLRHSSGQYSVVNSLALKKAGINKNTPDPFGGKIMRDPATGEPTGVLLHYPAENLVMKLATGYGDISDAELEADAKRAQELCLAAGITSGQDVIVDSPRFAGIYKSLADKNELKVRMYVLYYIESEEEAREAVKQIKGYKSDKLTIGGWKLAIDGGISAGTTLMYDNTLTASKYAYYYYQPEVLNRIVSMLHNTGLQISFHIVGDKGIDEALDAVEAAMKANPIKDTRHRIEHALFVKPTSLSRIKNLGMVISTQPQWISWNADGYLNMTSKAAMAELLPIKTMLNAGIPLAFGCDVPAAITHEPFWAFIGAVSRKTLSGYVPNPQECISINETLRIHTMGSAYAAFEEKEKGSIEAGKLADIVVWSQDITTTKLDDISKLESLMTIVGGQIVYEKK